jgi:hypothetical protein
MGKHVLLNNIDHKDLKIITKKSSAFGDNISAVLVFPTEFRDLQTEYPIFFQKNPDTAQFQAVAMLGFEQGQNLFLDDKGWHASYIPAVVNRDPFLIGYQQEQKDGQLIRKPVIHIDIESPRISKNDEGTPVFLPLGGNSEYLERVSRMLLVISEGVPVSKAMFDRFISLDLMEPFKLNVEFNDGAKHELMGNYTINEEKLYQLSPEILHKLNTSGYLFSAYMVIASMGNFRKLIDKRNALIAKSIS